MPRSEDRLPWYTVIPENVQASGLMSFKSHGFVPEFAVLDAEENRLATDDEAFNKVEELAKGWKKN